MILMSHLPIILTELDKMRREMEEEIKAQMMANQEQMGSWDDRVSLEFLLVFYQLKEES